MISRLKTANKVVGIKQVKRALTSHEVDILYLANDADEFIKQQVLELAKDRKIQIIELETMRELGDACGIDVGAATAALLKNTN